MSRKSVALASVVAIFIAFVGAMIARAAGTPLPATHFYFHSVSRSGNSDQVSGTTPTFDTTAPTGTDAAHYLDVPGVQDTTPSGPTSDVDPIWHGTVNGEIDTLT